jgi:hypothetical protein
MNTNTKMSRSIVDSIKEHGSEKIKQWESMSLSERLNDVADKFESQEKEIDYLKKNAIAQEIKINELSKLIDMLIVVVSGPMERPDMVQAAAYNQLLVEGNTWDPEQNKIFVQGNRGHQYRGVDAMARNILAKKVEDNKKIEKARIEELIRKQVEEQEKLKAKELAEKKEKAMKDMMARVTLLEETAKKEEDELESLKGISEAKSDEEIEDSEMEELLVREANALARAAEMRAEKAKLRGTQKNKTKASKGDPSTWSNEKAEKISKMWVE